MKNRSSRPARPGCIPSFEPLEGRRLMAARPLAPMEDLSAPRAAEVTLGAAGRHAFMAGRLGPEVVGQLNAAIDRAMAEQDLPGVAVGIWIPGSGRFLATRGDANLETGRARGASDPFRIASITKAFTATAVLQLADRGRLSLDDTLARWFPDFPHASEITVDDLLRMRSGLPDTVVDILPAYYADPQIRITPGEEIARAAARADEFRPAGTETVYNNLNYLFLQEIVRDVTGRDLGASIRQLILEPLGLTHTYYPNRDRLVGPLRGYSLDPASGAFVDKTTLNPGVAGGAGAMVSTIRDLSVFARALGTGTLLRPATQRARLDGETIAGEPDFVKYGMGIEQLGPFVGHNGTIFGFSSEMFYLPELGATIVVNVNRLDADDHSWSTDLFLELTKIAFPEYVEW